MRLFQRGRNYWADFVDGDGKRIRRSLGTNVRAEAEARAKGLLAESLTVRQVLDRWYKSASLRCKPRTRDLYRIVKKRFGGLWGDLNPQETLMQIGLAHRTINHQVGVALQAIQWAHERDLISDPPPKAPTEGPEQHGPCAKVPGA